MDYMSNCRSKQFDWTIADPPYFNGPDKLGYYGARISPIGVDRPGYKKTTDWDVPGEDYFREVIRVSKNQIIWGINYYPIQNIGPGRIIWDKVNGKSSFSDCEIAYVSSHDSVRIFPFMWNGMMQGKGIRNGRIQQGNKKLNEVRIHPTQKPVALYDWLLSKYVKNGMTVLDTHLGSGSSCISAYKAGIDLVGCEKTKSFAIASQKRLDEFMAQGILQW